MHADEAGPEGRHSTRPRSDPARRYGFALLVVGLALGVSYLLRGILRPHPTVLFFAAVVVTALFAGLGPSILATALSALAIEFVFFDPAWSLGLHEVRDLIVLATFGGVAVAVSWLAARADRSRRELARQRQEAEEATRRMTLLSEATRLMGDGPSARWPWPPPAARAAATTRRTSRWPSSWATAWPWCWRTSSSSSKRARRSGSASASWPWSPTTSGTPSRRSPRRPRSSTLPVRGSTGARWGGC